MAALDSVRGRQARGEREQDTHAGTVEVLHAGQVHDERAAVRGGSGGQAERVAEPVGVAHVDLARHGHDRDSIRAGPGG